MNKIPMGELIKRASQKFNNYCSYSKVDLNKSKNDSIIITCPKCGDVETTMKKHLESTNPCPQCYKNSIVDTLQKFSDKANKIHNFKYTYIQFTKTTELCTINCSIHGDFKITANAHLAGSGCPLCRVNPKQFTQEEIIRKFKRLSDEFIYDKVIYKGIDVPVTIVHPEFGEFETTPWRFLKNPKVSKKLSNEYHTNLLNYIHGQYSYPNFIYRGAHKKIKIMCQKHGIFTQTYDAHKNGEGCPQCSYEQERYNKLSNNENLVKFEQVHGGIYSYPEETTKNNQKIKIMCPKHGEFLQTPEVHKRGSGCPKCSGTKAELEILKLVPEAIYRDRQCIPLELDIYSKGDKFAIEYNGIMWHSFGKSKYRMFDNAEMEDKNKHLNKTELCEAKGIQLFHIFENEWVNKAEIWKSVISSKLNRTTRIYARKCQVKELNPKQSREFEEINHLQGSSNSSIRLGLFHKDELVQVMTFGKARFSKQYQYELIRMCSKLNTSIIGGASKLLKYFERTYNPESIVSYANRRWSQGNVYEKLGFEFTHNSEPNYFYFHPNSMKLESRNKYQKHKLSKLILQYEQDKSEKENMFNNGYRRIWDCGNKVYIKKYKEYI